uniref:DnaA ATPase domain-containing protein n=1 Tax=Staphylococcus hominis TaxID=1290 RepID=UPI0021B5B246
KKEIDISSDRGGKEIGKLEDGLGCRFEWGVIVDMRGGDYERGMGMLEKKMEEEKLEIRGEGSNYIANEIE